VMANWVGNPDAKSLCCAYHPVGLFLRLCNTNIVLK
jgi:hypothetical protein